MIKPLFIRVLIYLPLTIPLCACKVMSQTIPPGLPTDLVIQNDIRYSIALGMSHLNNFFDRDKDNAPCFYSNYGGKGDGVFIDADASGISHVVGRGLLAMMLAEQVTGIPFPEDGLQIFERYLKKAFNNPYNLNCYIDSSRNNQYYAAGHNMREGLYGLISLIRGRNREWARAKARLMIAEIEQLTSPDGHFTQELAKKAGLENRLEGIGGDDATTSGRLIEPLLEYYQLTGNKTAFRLAGLYASATLKSAYTEDGNFRPMAQSGGHIHSLTSTLSGITKYAVATNDKSMLAACVKIMDAGIARHSTSWGWVDEVTADHPANVSLRGEVNQTGDVFRTALTLGRAGYTRYYELAERFLRNMLLQGQHTEASLKRFMRDNPHPANDNERAVLSRSIGGYSMQLPNDRMREGDWPITTLDITSGAVHALCEAWSNGAEISDTAVRINLLFDQENRDISFRSSLPLVGKLRFFNKLGKDLYVRLPSWLDTTTLALEIQGKSAKPVVENGYLHIGRLKKGTVGSIVFQVTRVIKNEKAEDQDYHVTWWGDQVIAIDPPGKVSPIPFKLP